MGGVLVRLERTVSAAAEVPVRLLGLAGGALACLVRGLFVRPRPGVDVVVVFWDVGACFVLVPLAPSATAANEPLPTNTPAVNKSSRV